MATVIKLKKSETASSVPTTSNLAAGEVAVNTADQKIYVLNHAYYTHIFYSATASLTNSKSRLENIT